MIPPIAPAIIASSITIAESSQFIDVARLVAAGIVGGLVATFAGHKLAQIRDSSSGKSGRKREFLAYMKPWQHEIERLHLVTGGRERRQMSFYDGVSGFCVVAEMIGNDFTGKQKNRFAELVATVTEYGKLNYGYKEADLKKAIDEMITIAEKV
jgi:hypothetical protein